MLWLPLSFILLLINGRQRPRLPTALDQEYPVPATRGRQHFWECWRPETLRMQAHHDARSQHSAPRYHAGYHWHLHILRHSRRAAPCQAIQAHMCGASCLILRNLHHCNWAVCVRLHRDRPSGSRVYNDIVGGSWASFHAQPIRCVSFVCTGAGSNGSLHTDMSARDRRHQNAQSRSGCAVVPLLLLERRGGGALQVPERRCFKMILLLDLIMNK